MSQINRILVRCEKNAGNSTETIGFLASPSARSYNKWVSGIVPSALRPNLLRKLRIT